MAAEPWTRQQSIELLNKTPLPSTFTWEHREGGERPVVPKHEQLSGGYGKWLSEGPQFPGLFELINDILADADTAGDSSWIVSQEAGQAVESWPQFLALELTALRKKYAARLEIGGKSAASQLRKLRVRPNAAPTLF